MRRREFLRALAWGTALGWGISFPAAALTVNDIARQVICDCGCNKVLSECDMERAAELRKIIAGKIDAGWDEPRILSFMVQEFGERILAAPTKKGFNLTAWIVPFAGLFAGAGIVGFAIRRWVRAPLPDQAGTVAPAREQLEQKYGARLEEELARFERGR